MRVLEPNELAELIKAFVFSFSNAMNLDENPGFWVFRLVDSTGDPRDPRLQIPIRDSPILLCLNIGANHENKKSLVSLIENQLSMKVENLVNEQNQYLVVFYTKQAVGIHSVLKD